MPSVTSSDLREKSVFAPTFYSLLQQMPYCKLFSVVDVSSILSLNQMKTTSISNSLSSYVADKSLLWSFL